MRRLQLSNFLFRALGCAFLSMGLLFPPPGLAQDVPVSGHPVPEMSAWDEFGIQAVRDGKAPGAALAVVRDGKLVYSRAFGVIRPDADTPAHPDSIFRLGSISKLITNIALETLINEGKLSLDTRVFADILPDLLPPGADPRFSDIRLGHLITHSTGLFDDIRCHSGLAVQRLQAPNPTPPELMTRLFPLAIRFSANPGEQNHYNNIHHVILARVIERITGLGYEHYVRDAVFAPVGIHHMRIGNTRLPDLAFGESQYFDPPSDRYGSSGHPEDTRPTPLGHQLCSMEMQDGAGGWAGTAPELALFAARRSLPTFRLSQGSFSVSRNDRTGTTGGGPNGWGIAALARHGNGSASVLFLNGIDSSSPWWQRFSTPDGRFWPIVDELHRRFFAHSNWPEQDLLSRDVIPDALEGVSLSHSSLAFSWAPGTDPSALTMDLEIAAPADRSFRILNSALWLHPDRRTLTGPGILRLRANPNGLLPGKYHGGLTIQSETLPPRFYHLPLTFEVSAPRPDIGPLQILPQPLPFARKGQSLDIALATSAAVSPVEWAVVDGILPPGLSLRSPLGRISGVPSESGRFEFVLEVRDALGRAARRGFLLPVDAPGFNFLRPLSAFPALSLPSAGCSAQPLLGSIPPSTPSVSAVFPFLGGVRPGDELSFDWVRPDGAVINQGPWRLTWDQPAWTQTCFTASLNLASLPASARPGKWSVRSYLNRVPLSTAAFTIE